MVDNVEAAISEFDSNTQKGNVTFIRVLESNKTAFQKVVGEDGTIDDIRENLKDWLEYQGRNPNNTNKYCIQYFKQYKVLKNGIKADDAIHCYLQFKPGTIGAVGYPSVSIPPEIYNMMKDQAETNKAILSLLTAKNAQEDEDEDETNEQDKLGIVGQIMAHPQLGPAAMAIIGQLATKFVGGNKGIAGVENNYKKEFEESGFVLQEKDAAILILRELMDKGVTVEHLVKLNTMPTLKLKSLLMML